MCNKISAVLLILAMGLSNSFLNAENQADETKHIKVALRMIGHQLLLNAGDSTSRVLPIVEDAGRYSIQFESEFSFNPAELVASIDEVVEQTNLGDSYIVEVTECAGEPVVYSYEVGVVGNEDIVPCSGRLQPRSCYVIFFTLNETEPLTAAWYDPVLLMFTDPGWAGYTLVLLVFAILAVLIFRKKKDSASMNPNLIPLGELYFDKINNLLIKDGQQKDLTSKEADLLLLLYSEANSTVQREVILNRVWGDEGDYVGRTLDVFISKLRKKLDLDSKVKIVNIRGVGYKMILEAS